MFLVSTTDKIPINRAAKSPALQKLREIQKFHFVQRCRCSTMQTVPDFSRAKGRHVLGDTDEEPSFTHFHFSWCLTQNTSTQAAADVSHITPDSYHTSFCISFIDLVMDLLCLCNSFGYSIVLSQGSIGLNCRTQRLVFEALFYIQYCNLYYVYGLNYSCLKGIQASPVFIFKPAVCLSFKYKRLVLLQVSTQILSSMPLEQRITPSTK